MADVTVHAGLAAGVGRAYSPDVATRSQTPRVTSLGLEVQKEYVILQSESVGDLVQMELVTDGRTSSPGLGNREDALAEIMVEIAEDRK